MELAIHSFSLSVIPYVMSLNIDMKIIRPWNCSGSPILFVNFWTSWTSCNVVNPAKIFHSNSIGSPSIVSKVLKSGETLNQLNFLPKKHLMLGSDSPFQGITQNLKKNVNLRVRETGDFFITDQR